MGLYSDLDRPPLNEKALNRALARDGSFWREIRVVSETGSTNADVAALAAEGAREGVVVVAEAQTAGRGRLGRSWAAPPRSGLMFSVLLRPGASVPATRLGWLPLLTGVAVATAVRSVTTRAQAGEFGEATGGAAVEAALKWPNDVLVGDRKLAGILAERAEGAVVVGVGLNVSLRAAELPVPTATSLLIEDAATTDRETVLKAILRELALRYTEWRAADGDPDGSGLRGAYRALSATLGRDIRVELPGGTAETGTARDVDAEGRLVAETARGERAYSAGDVVHVRNPRPIGH
ncbi:biotin--[acetyl-CoA-carboxylase] ligase [Actinocorallia sp. API 0066]|uniref:biotin--[acetyl-CoA-carboxylase] ligase n=1 Tax=Actinocorallia sp. API 0066 TaxID=2896846 RepID=UPI001E3EBEEC|nr:biotin--[acetyl-CoA-carboxylase] ligase [Actinocorallia sp. API 0066]MCD0453060.1 biotin--[acetyl-CoA-carboxylase] ligase [Actinocorallia sp. API 0066]